MFSGTSVFICQQMDPSAAQILGYCAELTWTALMLLPLGKVALQSIDTKPERRMSLVLQFPWTRAASEIVASAKVAKIKAEHFILMLLWSFYCGAGDEGKGVSERRCRRSVRVIAPTP